ncbi:glycoside hydrolase family 88 protein [Paenibacillus sp. An7]|uniref:glycoside hydrolase family 88 protein n=1 Tax=Paenibacillus sp. An7 TaxID=2689577 RepID=UPI00135B0BCA|nr:glycoside hydrolase family 88 protein [Paenibacillus sp. An7]
MDNLAMRLVTQWIKNYPMLIHCTWVSDRWHYEQGCLLKGIHDVYMHTGENDLLEYIRTNMDRYVENDGNIRTYREQDYNLDQINNGKMQLQLYRYMGFCRSCIGEESGCL